LKYNYSQRPESLVQQGPKTNLGIVITIPCYHETDIVAAVESIRACELPPCHTEIIILINEPKDCLREISAINEIAYQELNAIKEQSGFSVCPIYVNEIMHKKAGVGLARKLAMDEACTRLDLSQHEPKIIACYDADCSCAPNYLTALYDHFSENDGAVSIYFEHPDANPEGTKQTQAIYDYELHLRYFIQFQKHIGLPFAFHTVGSSMALTSTTYQKIGGMNTRKAGEDFYFLQKCIKAGLCQVLANTTVFPSGRISDRVPFGTGKAVQKILSGEVFLTYHPQSFLDLEEFISDWSFYWKANEQKIEERLETYPVAVKAFLYLIQFDQHVQKLVINTKSKGTFYKSFFQFFDAFTVMKYLHFARDHQYENVEIEMAASTLLNLMTIDPSENLLNSFRDLDKV